jgi:hypothetical protein
MRGDVALCLGSKRVDMAGRNGYDMVPVAATEEEVANWMDQHEPLSRAALNTVDSKFMRTVGEPARMSSDLKNLGGMTEKNPHMRVAPPSEFGVFAYKEDVVLIELDEDVACGELIGYPVGTHRWVPVLFCLSGPVERVRDRMELVLVTVGQVTDGNLAL